MDDPSQLPRQPWAYLSILKGRQAEYDALRQLDHETRRSVTALIALRDGKKQGDALAALVKLLDDLRITFDLQGPILLDGQWLEQPASFGAILEGTRGIGWIAVPATTLDRPASYQAVVREATQRDKAGLAIRVSRSDFAGLATDVERRFVEFLSSFDARPEDVDIVLDLRDVVFEHLAADELAVVGMLAKLPRPTEWRHVALAASGMPAYMTNFPRNDIEPTPRVEWWLWQGIYERRDRLPRLPVFGDYAIAHPDPVEDVDGAFLPQTAQLRYTTADAWLMVRGYDIKKEGSEHFPPLLRSLMEHGDYCGPDYSAGDQWVADVVSGKANPGQAVIWRRAGTAHHLTFVTRQLAKWSAA